MDNIQTQRLFLTTIDYCDSAFYLALVNTPGWLTYIGNRNIYSDLDAQHYIQGILDNPQSHFWTVHLTSDQKPIGAISLIKRDYLDAHDLGFAFLPQYTNMGYAYESAHAVVEQLKEEQTHTQLYATTLPENKSSIKLLLRLGFHFVDVITPMGELLHLYCIKMIAESK